MKIIRKIIIKYILMIKAIISMKDGLLFKMPIIIAKRAIINENLFRNQIFCSSIIFMFFEFYQMYKNK